jgi:dTDP-glucose 4,6-dehydratase
MKKILITGGMGFMGSHFVKKIYHDFPEYGIVNLDIKTYAGNRENLKDIPESDNNSYTDKYTFVKGNIADKKLVDELFKKHNFEFVFHFAAESHVDRSMFNFGEFINTNVVGAHVIIENCHKYKVKKLIFISTDEVYGDIDTGFTNEETKLNPSSPYSASKTSGDMIATTYIKLYNDPIIIVRSGNNYGTNQYPEKLIPLTISNLLHNQKIPVHGTGKYYRSWVHVEDFCDAILLLAEKGPRSGIYNIAGEQFNNLEILSKVGKAFEVEIEKYLEFVPDRPVQDKRYAPDATKIKNELGFVNKRKFDNEIGKIVNWYKENIDWVNTFKSRRDSSEYFSLAQLKGYFNWNK